MSQGGKNFGAFGGRVGSKAGGFIAKKFFHPSSISNQQKVWQAEEREKEKEKAQAELQRQRDEEAAVMELRKQMHNNSGKVEDVLFHRPGSSDKSKYMSPEEQKMAEEVAKRKKMMKKEEDLKAAAAEKAAEIEEGAAPVGRSLTTKSKYKEDVSENGHTGVWGSYFEKDEMKWGYSCCKVQVRGERCPLAKDEPEQKKRKK